MGYLVLGSEEKTETTIMDCIGTTVRIHSFIPSEPKVSLKLNLQHTSPDQIAASKLVYHSSFHFLFHSFETLNPKTR